MADLFTLTCDKLQEIAFVGFRGTEQISRPYEFELFFTAPVGTAVRDAIGQRASLKAQRSEDAEPVLFHGVIAEVSLVHQNTNKARGPEDRALYRALLVPRLWLLQQFWRSFVFVEKNVKEFLTDTLEAGGLLSNEFRFDIDAGAYPKEEFVAQYRESYLDFFHRWLEREGLYYYFEHKDGASSEVLVIVEDKSHAEPFPGEGKVRYFPLMGDETSVSPALHELTARTRWLPKTVTVADYDYSNPTTPVKGDSPVTKNGVGTIRDYGFRVFVESEAKRLAKIKAQAIGCRETTLRASGTCLGPRAGYKLTIDERPDDIEEEWLAVEVEHVGSLRGMTEHTARLTGLPAMRTYTVKLFAIPASVQYRAPQSTAWPRIYGFENGIVMGEADSPYAQLDADGRYLVRFEFDTSEIPDGKVSTRIRMLQPHGGDKEGFHFPLRKGTEVMVSFLGGDCDRPFISGVVPNAHKPSVIGSRNHTQNIIRTGSNNQLVLEDEQGKEFIFMHTPNQRSGIYMGHPAGAHSSVYTGERDEASTYASTTGPASAAPPGQPTPPGAQANIEETASMHLHTEMNQLFFIGGSATTFIGTGPENTYVGGNVIHGFKGTYGLMVGQAADEFYYNVRNTTVSTGRTDKVLAGGVTQEYTDKLDQKVHGPWTNVTDGKFDGKFASNSVTIVADGGDIRIHGDTSIHLDAPDIFLNARNIHLVATAAVRAEAPSWLTRANSWLKNNLAIENAAYVGKNSLVVEKVDVTVGASGAVTATKWEATGMGKSVVVFKQDLVAVNTSKTGIDASTKGVEKKVAAACLENGAFKSAKVGFRLM